MKNITKNNWFISCVVNLSIMAIMLAFTTMTYETNDDYAIAARIVDGYTTLNFINYYLCNSLAFIQRYAGTLNIYIASQLVIAFVSFTLIVKIILDKTDYFAIRWLSVVVVLFFSIDHYCAMQFTKTAALAITAGFVVMINALTDKRKWFYYLFGIFLIVVGAMFRIDGLLAGTAFAGVYILLKVWNDRKDLKSIITYKQILLCFVLIATIVGCFALDNASNRANANGNRLKQYIEYNDLRYRLVDFPVLSDYDKYAEEFEQAGFSRNDIALIRGWHFDYDGAASPENLRKLVEITGSFETSHAPYKKAVRQFAVETVNDLKELNRIGLHIIVLVIIAFCSVVVGGKRTALFTLLTGMLAVALYIYLYYLQRPAYRAFYIADIGASIWLCYSMSENYKKDKSKLITAILICSMIAIIVLVKPMNDKCISLHEKCIRGIMSEEMQEYFNNNKDSFYVFCTSENKRKPSYAEPLIAPETSKFQNIASTGGWATMSPYLLDKFSMYGVRNPIADLIDRKDAYYVGNEYADRLLQYYNKWYADEQSNILMEEVDSIDGLSIWSVKKVR